MTSESKVDMNRYGNGYSVQRCSYGLVSRCGPVPSKPTCSVHIQCDIINAYVNIVLFLPIIISSHFLPIFLCFHEEESLQGYGHTHSVSSSNLLTKAVSKSAADRCDLLLLENFFATPSMSGKRSKSPSTPFPAFCCSSR